MRASEFLTEASTLTPGELYKNLEEKPNRVDIFLDKVKEESPFILAKDGSKFIVDPSEYNELKKLFTNLYRGQITVLKKGTKDTYIPLGALSKTPEFGGAGKIKSQQQQIQLPFGKQIPQQSARSEKEGIEIKPSDIFQEDVEYNESSLFQHIITNNKLEKTLAGNIIISMTQQIQRNEFPTIVNKDKTPVKSTGIISAIRDYAGEYLGIASLYKGLTNFTHKEGFFKHIGLKSFKDITITFPSKSNVQLADSIGVFKNKTNGREIWISSKGGGGGASASLSNAFKIPDELLQNKEFANEIKFMEINNSEDLDAKTQPFALWNFLYDVDRKKLPFSSIGKFTQQDIAQTLYLMQKIIYDPNKKAKILSAKDIVNLPQRSQDFLFAILGVNSVPELIKKKPNLKTGRSPGLIVWYYLKNALLIAVNQNNILPNFEPFVREILQNNFIQINANLQKNNELHFDVLWPNRELATGRITLEGGKSGSTQVKGKMTFKIHAN